MSANKYTLVPTGVMLVSYANDTHLPAVAAYVLAVIDKTERYFAFSDDPAVDLRNARTAVAAMIEREAALIAERDALAAEVKALREGFSQEAITKHVSEYEYRGEEADMYGVNGVYSPQAFDRLLIEDAMRSWADHVNSIHASSKRF